MLTKFADLPCYTFFAHYRELYFKLNEDEAILLDPYIGTEKEVRDILQTIASEKGRFANPDFCPYPAIQDADNQRYCRAFVDYDEVRESRIFFRRYDIFTDPPARYSLEEVHYLLYPVVRPNPDLEIEENWLQALQPSKI